MNDVDQDIVVMYTLVTICRFSFSIYNLLAFIKFIRFITVVKMYLDYLLLSVSIEGIYFWGLCMY